MDGHPSQITTVSPFIQSVVDISLDPRNVATTNKPNFACGATVINIQNYSEHVLCIHSLADVHILNMYVIHDDQLYLMLLFCKLCRSRIQW